MLKRVVWASDGSEAADMALPFAKELATGEGRSLVAVHSNELFVGGRGSGHPVLADEDELERKIENQVEEAKKEGIDATFRLIGGGGNAAHMIADAAREVGADVIVVGTRGQAPVAGLLLGSVTQRLLQVSSCPVLAVPSSLVRAAAAAEAEE